MTPMALSRFVAFHDVAERELPDHMRPTFAVMIADSIDGAVLVFSRYRKVWELPGGLIDPGETPRQAAERELMEEAGCIARDTRWQGIVEVNDGSPHFGVVFTCETSDVPIRFENAETGGIAFWPPDLEPMGHSDAALLEKFG